jgi:hypothetical protein
MCYSLLLSFIVTETSLLILAAFICCIRDNYASNFVFIFCVLWADGTKSSTIPIECGTRAIGYYLWYKEHSTSLSPLRTVCVGVRIWCRILRPVSRDPHVGGPLIHLPVSTLVRACVSYLPKGDHIFTRFECFPWKFPNNFTGTVLLQLNNGNTGISRYTNVRIFLRHIHESL